jgi:acetyl-CoA C-acetyltransferase
MYYRKSRYFLEAKVANENATIVIVHSARTPIGKLGGALSSVPAPRLGAAIIQRALLETKLDGKDIDEIIMGQVLTAGVGQAPARQTAIYGGLPNSVCATTINRVCGSGLKSIMLGTQAIQTSEAKFVFAGGQESMSLAPHILMGSRAGFKFGTVELKDSMQSDGLWDPYGNVSMGNCAEICAKEYQFSRESQDQYATESYTRARKAIESGSFSKEIVPIEVPGKKGPSLVEVDEQPFSVDLDRLPSLKPAFDKSGTVTAGNSSSINDGAAAVLLTDLNTARQRGLRPIAKIVAQASHAQDPNWFTTAPIACINKVLKKAGLAAKDIDLFEINEAFSVVALAAIKDLKLARDQINIFGGAIALGHPIGASGARVVVTLLNALAATGQKRGLATLCIGGGEASAIIVEMY